MFTLTLEAMILCLLMAVALEIAVLHSVANDIANVIVALKQSQSNVCRWIQLLKLDC